MTWEVVNACFGFAGVIGIGLLLICMGNSSTCRLIGCLLVAWPVAKDKFRQTLASEWRDRLREVS